MPENFSVLVGETAYNLRAALDYLVYELAFLDSGEKREQTQFPITSSLEVFASTGERRLVGVSQRHVAVIEGLQPYKGDDWLAVLPSLSNQDKHRELVAVVRTPAIRYRIESRETAEGDPEHVHAVVDIAIETAFDDGALVLETLRRLHQRVADTLDTFKPDF